jgi:ribonuclease D
MARDNTLMSEPQATVKPMIASDPVSLDQVITKLAREQVIAMDTEFVRESTYFARLCLVQAATTDYAACIDCVADLDLGAFVDTLTRADCHWVVHSARQDLEVFWQTLGRLPASLTDTQIAAGLLGYPPQIGLQSLLAEVLDVNLDKHFTRLDWSRRPLPEDALLYAVDDVRYLLPLWQRLEDRLRELGRLDWLAQDCAGLLATSPETDAITVWSRLKSVQAMSAEQQCAALALVEWREARARAANRPRRWILADDAVARIARALPDSMNALREIPDLPGKLLQRSGDAILTAVNARHDEAIRTHVGAMEAADPPDRQRVRELKQQLRENAEALGIEPEVLATRRDVEEIARGRCPWPSGSWRAQQLAELLAF